MRANRLARGRDLDERGAEDADPEVAPAKLGEAARLSGEGH